MSDKGKGVPGPSKRKRTDDGCSDTTLAVVPACPFRDTQMHDTLPAGTSDTEGTQKYPPIPREFDHPTISISPKYLAQLKLLGILGFRRPEGQRIPTPRYYEIDPAAIRRAILELLTKYLTFKLHDRNCVDTSEIPGIIAWAVPLIVDACMAAIYAKLCTIHQAYGTYAHRFTTPPTYTKDLELPLPFADAIDNLGVFNPNGLVSNWLVIPVYPEGTRHEGHSSEICNSYQYESYIACLKDAGIPVKSVDTHLKTGSSWWTYKVELVNKHFDLRCIFPASNYSDHSTMLAAMFLLLNEDETAPTPIVKHLNDDTDYPVRLREARPGFEMRVFAALCHAPRVEWSLLPSTKKA